MDYSPLSTADLAVLTDLVADAEDRAQQKAVDSTRLECDKCRDTASAHHAQRLAALGRIRRAIRANS